VRQARLHVLSEPVRLFRLADEDDLVGGEGPQRIGDGERQVGIPDTTLRVDAAAAQPVEGGGESLRRAPARRVVAGEPVPEPGVERGSDNEHGGAAHVPRNRAVGAERDYEYLSGPYEQLGPCSTKKWSAFWKFIVLFPFDVDGLS
jgi:hypothetical protein